MRRWTRGVSMPETVTVHRTPESAGDLVGAVEASEILRVERTRVSRYIKTGVMPPPLAKLRATSVWLREDVEKLAKRREEAKVKREGAKAMVVE